MNHSSVMPEPRSQSPIRDWIIVWVCGTLLGLLASSAVTGCFDAGISPLKPSIFLWGSAFFCIGMAIISQPKFSPTLFFILVIPVWRMADVALFARFDKASLDEATMSTLRTLLGVVTVLAVLSNSKSRPAILWAAILAIVLTTGSEIGEAAGLAKFTGIPGRFSGFSGHPNSPPMILCEMLGIVFALSQNFRINMIMLAICVPGVALTYGRSGMVCLALMGLVYVAMNARKHLGFILLMVVTGLPLLGLGFTFLQSNTEKGIVKDKDTGSRLEAIYTLDFDKLKSPERAQDLAAAWTGVQEKPIFGQGVGSSGTLWAPHNELVSIWLELGIPGILVFVLLHGILMLGSMLHGGRAAYCIFAILFYVPAAQGRIDTVHYWLAAAVTAHVIWGKRYALALSRPQPRSTELSAPYPRTTAS